METGNYVEVPAPAAPTHDALADEFFAALDTALKTDERTTWTGTVKHTHRERAHAWSTFNALREKVISALRQSGAGSKEAERYEWLCADLDAEQRAKRSHLFNRMSVMGKGAIDAFIDAALKERTE